MKCGSPMGVHIIENKPREFCPICNWIYYPQLKVTAGVLVEAESKILLIQRAKEPWRGLWYLPAGYVENDESPRDAAEREGFEETGFSLRIDCLRDIYYYDDDPRGNGILILYSASILGGEINENEEAMSIKFYKPSELEKLKLAGKAHKRAIADWLKISKEKSI